MTFNEWLNQFNPDWQSEYSGHAFAMESAWNAAIAEAMKADNIASLLSAMPEFAEWRERAKGSER